MIFHLLYPLQVHLEQPIHGYRNLFLYRSYRHSMDNRYVLTFVAKRSAELLILFLIVITLFFVAYKTTISDPAALVITPRMTPDVQAQLRELWGLDRSLTHQYIIYMRNILRGDHGMSFYYGTDVSEVVKARTLPTLLLSGSALILALLLDFSLEKNKGTSVPAGMLFYLVPFLFIGLLLLALSYHLDIFPVGGMKSKELVDRSIAIQTIDIIRHLVLPCAVMVIWSFTACLLVKANIRGILQEKKGIIPPIMMTVLAASVLFFGSKITEIIFSWPGYHSAVLEASLSYDYPLAQSALITAWAFNLVIVVCIEVFYLFRVKQLN